MCRSKNHIEAKRFISLLQVDLLAGLKKRNNKAAQIAGIGKNRSDCKKMKALPPIEDMKKMVKQAMFDLCTISNACADKDVTFGERLAANTCIVGIIFYNGFGGRSNEWEVMPAAHVAEQLAEGIDFLVCPNHKTATTYGELGKYLAPGTFEAVKTYVTLGSSSSLFLVPPKETSTRVSIACMLKRFNKKYGPQYQNATVNLFRKWYHTEVVNPKNQGSVMKFMARIDGHSEAVAQKVYVTSDPEQDALVGKHLVAAILGDTVEFLSESEIQQCDRAAGEAFTGEGACDSDDGSTSDDDSASCCSDLPDEVGGSSEGARAKIVVVDCDAEDEDDETFGVKRCLPYDADGCEQPKRSRPLLQLVLSGTSGTGSLCPRCAASQRTSIMVESASSGSGGRVLACSNSHATPPCKFTSTV